MVVETQIETEIGIQADWPEDNLPALIQMLADEINEKTDYRLSLQPWNEDGQVYTRLKVGRAKASAESLEQAIARAARERGIELSDDKVAAIKSALGIAPRQ